MIYSMLALLTAFILYERNAHWFFWGWFMTITIADLFVTIANTIKG